MPKALVIQLRQFGDVLMTVPSVQLLKDRGYEVDVLTENIGEWVYRQNPNVRKVFIWKKGKGSFRHLLGVLAALRKQKYELVFDFQGLPKTLFFSFLLGAGLRIGMTRSLRRYFYNRPCRPDGTYPALQELQFAGSVIGLTKGDFDLDVIPKITLTQTERDKAAKVFAEVKSAAGRKKIILLCPVSRQPYKVWDPHKMAELCKALQQQKLHLLAILGPGQKQQVTAVNDLLSDGGAPNQEIQMLGAKLSLREWHGIAEQCAAYVGVDGGHKHLSLSAGIPVFTLYHNVSPFWHPPHLRSHAFADLTPKTNTEPRVDEVIVEVSQFLRDAKVL